jgi:soluble lytic murein transglycosylase
MGGHASAHEGERRVTLKLALMAALVIGIANPASAASDEQAVTAKWSSQLGPNAKSRYQDVFAAIRSARWAEARALLTAMPEGPLHTVAYAELYLAKGSPIVDGATLAALAAKSPELPQSRKLMALAQGRGASASFSLPSQQELYWLGTAPRRGKVAGSDMKGLPLAGRIAPLIKNDQPNEAEALLEANSAGLSDETLTEWRHRIAWTYYLTGDDPAARRLAATAAKGVVWVISKWSRRRNFGALAQIWPQGILSAWTPS